MSSKPSSLVVLVLIVLLALGSWMFWQYRSPLPPKVIGVTQLTHDGLAKMNLASDGANLYFTELSGQNFVISKVAAKGGDISTFPVAIPNARMLDVSLRRSSMLVAENASSFSDSRLWAYPLNGGAAQPFADFSGQEAVYAPDGQHVAFVKGSSLFVADAHGGPPRQLVTVKGTPYYPRFSPDGKRVRFSIGDVDLNVSTIWEMNIDGSDLNQVLQEWRDVNSKCCGSWTPDGRYYIFQATPNAMAGISSLFALGEPARRFERKRMLQPVKLTGGTVSFSRPVPAPDNKKIWALGLTVRGAVVSYDPATEKFSPFLSGISASDLDFSPDGQWVAYVSVPEGMLLRSKIDGSERRQLSFPPGRAALPRWSPDGKQIAYVNVEEGKPWAIFIVLAEGGVSKPLFVEKSTQIDINWSHDGAKIIFGRITQHSAKGLSILSYDLNTHQLSTIPGSEGLFSPRLSPDGRYIAALAGNLTALMLYDTQTQKWSTWQTLPSGALNYPVWASDSNSLFFEDRLSGEGYYCRAKVGESQYEHMFPVAGIERYLGPFGLWSGRTPDGSVLVVQEASTREVYALDVNLP